MVKKIQTEGDFYAFLKADLKKLMASGFHDKWHNIEHEIQADVNEAFSASYDNEETRSLLERVPNIIETYMPYGIFSPFYAHAAQNVLQVLFASSETPQSDRLIDDILKEAVPVRKKGVELIEGVLVIDGVPRGEIEIPERKPMVSIRELPRASEEQVDKLRA